METCLHLHNADCQGSHGQLTLDTLLFNADSLGIVLTRHWTLDSCVQHVTCHVSRRRLGGGGGGMGCMHPADFGVHKPC